MRTPRSVLAFLWMSLLASTGLAASPSDVLGPIPLTSRDADPADVTRDVEIERALLAGPEALETVMDGLRRRVGHEDPSATDLSKAYYRLRLLGTLPVSGATGGAHDAAGAFRTASSESLTRWVLQETDPAAASRDPSPEARHARIAADVAGPMGRRAEDLGDPMPLVVLMRAARQAGRPEAELQALLRKITAQAPLCRLAGQAYLGTTGLLRRADAGDLPGRIRSLAELDPDLAALAVAAHALFTYQMEAVEQQVPGGAIAGLDLDVAAVERLPRDLLRRGLRLDKPGRIPVREKVMAWLRLAALVDDQEVAAAAARRLALLPPQMAGRAPVILLPLLGWARGLGPRPPLSLPDLPRAAAIRMISSERILSRYSPPDPNTPNSDQGLATYAPGPLADDAVIPPRPTEPLLAFGHDSRVTEYVLHGAHHPALDARVLELLDRYNREVTPGLTDRKAWLAIRDDALSLIAAGCTDPLVRHAAAYLGCVAGEQSERQRCIDELQESGMALARSPYHPLRAFWALDSRTWIGNYLNVQDTPNIIIRDPDLARQDLMRELLARALPDPAVPDFAALEAARTAQERGIVDLPALVEFVRVARPWDGVLPALQALAARREAADLDGPDSSRKRQTLLKAADELLTTASARSPGMRWAAIDAVRVALDLEMSSDELLRRIARARQVAPRYPAAERLPYDVLLGSVRPATFHGLVGPVLDGIDDMLAHASSWDASALLHMVTLAQLGLAHVDMLDAWDRDWAGRPWGEVLLRCGRFRDERRRTQIRRAVDHALAVTDGTIRSANDHGTAALLLFLLGDEPGALRHFIAADRTIPDDIPTAGWFAETLTKRLAATNPGKESR